jgi:hypothetical protein
MNRSGAVDLDDVPHFVEALLSPETLSDDGAFLANFTRDVAADGAPIVDGRDLHGFVEALLP